ncbi:MAG: hypothetical protein KAQ94_10020 [Arcobacteraceae bacterium]|nr:hypothetical protein [Arcobacteraceae bacterium]
MKYIITISLFSSLSLFASTIDTSKKAITVTNATTLSKALDIAKKLTKYDIYIYKTTTTKVSYFIVYAVNINKNIKKLNLKNIKKYFRDAYLSSDKRVETLASNNFNKNIFIQHKDFITKEKTDIKITENIENVKIARNIKKEIKPIKKVKYNKIVKKTSSAWIDPNKGSITLHNPIYYGEAKYLANKYKYYDTFIYTGKYNFTVCIVNIDKKNIKSFLNQISKEIPTAAITSNAKLNYYYNKKTSTKSLFTKSTVMPKNYKTKQIDNKLFLHAKKEFNNKNYKKAIIFLTDFINQNNSHIEANFLLGRTYYLTNQFEEALAAYQKILIFNENLPRVKLELAQTYLALNMTEDALNEFTSVLSSNAPKNVKESIKKRIAFIKSQQTNHKFNYMFAINWLKDNNVNNTTSQKEYEIFAPLFNSYLTLYSDEIAPDKSKTYLFGINYNYRLLDDLKIETNFLKSSQTFEKYKDKKSDTLLLTSYLSRETSQDKLRAGIDISKNSLNNVDYQKIIGLGVNYQKRISQDIIGSVNFKVFQKKFYEPTNTDKESNNISLNLGQTNITKKFGNININLTATKEEKLTGTRSDIDNESYGLVLSDIYRWNNSFSTTLSTSYLKKSYSVEDINFLNKREDTTNSYSLSFNYLLYKNLSTTLNISKIDVKSNHAPFGYKKTTQNFGLMYTF